MITFKKVFLLFVSSIVMVSCGRNPNSTGTEFAPNMYVSSAYEPLTQVEKNKINEKGLNMRTPVKGTIARRNYIYTDSTGKKTDLGLMLYRTHKDSLERAAKNLVNPFPATPQILAEGQILYSRFCQPCHGEQGKGDGPVAKMYKGVPIYSSDAIKNVSGGHIFHVITHGKGRMWSHASQVSAPERWKIVHYVHTLQGGDQPAHNGNSDTTTTAVATQGKAK